jgi:hypothetical protein
MRLTDNELKHVLNVEWGQWFWRWFRWVLIAVLAASVLGGQLGWLSTPRREWLVIGVVYLLVAWPGLCRAYVYHALRRVIDEDPEASAQLENARANRRR